MSFDQIYKHKFYIEPAQASIQYQSENSMGNFSGVLIRDKFVFLFTFCIDFPKVQALIKISVFLVK